MKGLIEIMRLNKEKFLKTEFGAELKNCILCWDAALELKDNKTAQWCQAQWEVYQMALKQFYGVSYHFTRTDGYYGVVTDDCSEWLFKFERLGD